MSTPKRVRRELDHCYAVIGELRVERDRAQSEVEELRTALGHINSILREKDESGNDLQLGSTAFKSCLRWSSIPAKGGGK